MYYYQECSVKSMYHIMNKIMECDAEYFGRIDSIYVIHEFHALQTKNSSIKYVVFMAISYCF